ncbi:MAG: Uma2 family endonuclease [Anaerolineae bacterium]|jgi:Uma2 family endonuclease|nr:Uma2 family endonuclease [Anaerolineae bacterium]
MQRYNELSNLDDLWRIAHMPQSAQRTLELIDGKIIEKTPLSWLENDTAVRLQAFLEQYLRCHPVGKITAPNTGYTLDPYNVLIPTFGFSAIQHLPDLSLNPYLPQAPDLAIEIQETVDLTRARHYLRYGTHVVWLISMREKAIVIAQWASVATHQLETAQVTACLEGGDLLPGFQVRLSNLFSNRQLL